MKSLITIFTNYTDVVPRKTVNGVNKICPFS